MNQRYRIRCLKAIQALVGSRKDLADRLGVNPQTVAQWVHDGVIPPRQILNLLDLGKGKFSATELLGKYDDDRETGPTRADMRNESTSDQIGDEDEDTGGALEEFDDLEPHPARLQKPECSSEMRDESD